MKAWILYWSIRPRSLSSEVWDISVSILYVLIILIKFLDRAEYDIESNKPNKTTLSEQEWKKCQQYACKDLIHNKFIALDGKINIVNYPEVQT
jgi:hypothetical protein